MIPLELLVRSLPATFIPSDARSISALSIYDALVAEWISPLPRATSSLTRKDLSDLASRIASEVLLGSFVLRRPSLASDTQDPWQSQSQSVVGVTESQYSQQDTQVWNTAAELGDEDYTHSQPMTPNPYASQADPLDLPLTPRRSLSVLSGSSFTSTGFNAGDAAYERLSQYTTFKEQPEPLPARMGRILTHWAVGTDPEEYSWTATRRQIERGGEKALARRAERRARKMLAKQRREARVAEAKRARSASAARAASRGVTEEPGMRSSPIPLRPADYGTQVGLGEASQSQSQSQVSGLGVASQIERGAHGGRPPPAKRPRVGGAAGKRPRRAGF